MGGALSRTGQQSDGQIAGHPCGCISLEAIAGLRVRGGGSGSYPQSGRSASASGRYIGRIELCGANGHSDTGRDVEASDRPADPGRQAGGRRAYVRDDLAERSSSEDDENEDDKAYSVMPVKSVAWMPSGRRPSRMSRHSTRFDSTADVIDTDAKDDDDDDDDNDSVCSVVPLISCAQLGDGELLIGRAATERALMEVQDVTDLPLRDRCVDDVRDGAPARGLIPEDRPILFVSLDGTIMSCFLRGSLSTADLPDDVKPVSVDGQDALVRVRPGVFSFLNRMRWEAGLVVAVYTASSLEDAVEKVDALESFPEGIHFDFVIHGDTVGAWKDGQVAVENIVGEERGGEAFLIHSSATDAEQANGDGPHNVTCVSTFAPPALDASNGSLVIAAADKVFDHMEIENASLRHWLFSVSIVNTSFRETLQAVNVEVDSDPGDDQNDDATKTVHSAMSLHGINFVEVDPKRASTVSLAGLGLISSKSIDSRPLREREGLSSVFDAPGVRPARSFSLGEVSAQLSRKSMTSVGSGLRKLRKSLSNLSRRPSSKPNLHGLWVCTDTWGLDNFLKDCGISKMQRMAATKASWPSWEFEQDGDHIVFTNQTFMGKIREEFTVGGDPYTAVDGKRQKLECTARWQDDTLVIERTGPLGRFVETRRIDGEGQIKFELRRVEPPSGSSWGRTFRRA